MFLAISIFLGVFALLLLLRLHGLHKALRQLTNELKEINQEEPIHRHLQLPVPDRELELFAEELNRYLSDTFDRSFAQKKREQDVRREITNISHDLRTPLTSILGYLELLKDSSLSAEQMEYLDIIQKRSRPALRICASGKPGIKIEDGGSGSASPSSGTPSVLLSGI